MTIIRTPLTSAATLGTAGGPVITGQEPASGPAAEGSGITVRRVAGYIGAEIGGVDLASGLNPAEVAAVRAALLEHKVVFFRDQQLDPAQHLAFGRLFGEVTPAHPTLPSLPGHPEVLQLSTEDYAAEYGGGTDGPLIENLWHTDVTFVHNPPLGSILRAVDVPAAGGDTGWTNLVAAHQALSEPVRRFVAGLRAVHRNHLPVEQGSHAGRELAARFGSTPYATVHPVVRVHPETGERALFVNPNFTSHVVGLSNRESRRLLDLLYEVIGDPRFTVRFHWEPGSVAFWDNRATAHLASFDLPPRGGRRVMQRITLAGDVPVGPDGTISETYQGGRFV